MQGLASEHQACHVQVIQYDVASGDAFGTSVDTIVRNTLAHPRRVDRVMHCIGAKTAPSLHAPCKRLLAELRARGLPLIRLCTRLAEGAA
jgi:hypothetical protein